MIESNNDDNTVCAVVVTYFPASDFCRQIRTLYVQATKIVVIDNTPRESRKLQLKPALQAFHSALVIENDSNIGQAAALNQGITHAAESGCVRLQMDISP